MISNEAFAKGSLRSAIDYLQRAKRLVGKEPDSYWRSLTQQAEDDIRNARRVMPRGHGTRNQTT